MSAVHTINFTSTQNKTFNAKYTKILQEKPNKNFETTSSLQNMYFYLTTYYKHSSLINLQFKQCVIVSYNLYQTILTSITEFNIKKCLPPSQNSQ